MVVNAVTLTQELVRIPSTTGNENDVAQFLYKKIQPIFDSVEIDGIGNVIGEKIFDESRPTVLFNGHMDTVDPGDMENPFSGERVDGEKFGVSGDVIYGRGAADMKGALAVYLGAMSRLDTLACPPNVIFHAVVEEEPANGTGTTYAMKNLNIKPDVAVSGEATNLDICLGFRGWVQFKLETFGKTAHGSNPHQGINAVLMMRDFLNALDGYIAVQESKVHPFLGQGTCAVTNIACRPGRLSVVPDYCTLTFDSRYFPGESPQDREKEIQEILNVLAERNQNFKYKLEIVSSGMRPTLLSTDDKYVQLMKAAAVGVLPQEPALRAWKFTLDSSYIVNDFGIPTIGFGPGLETAVHTPQENIPVQHLLTAQEVYLKFMDLLGRDSA